MKIKTTFVLCCTALLFAACSNVYYPAMYHQDVAYMPTPTSFDSAKTANYLSAGLGLSTNASYNDELVSTQINASRGHKFNNFDLAYGVFGVAGEYENQNIGVGNPGYFTHKFYGAVGGRAAANFVISTKNTDVRIIGLEAAYSHEFGSFADFRNSLYTTQPAHFYEDPRTNLFTLGLTSEVIFHKYASTQHGISVFLGDTFGHNILNDTYFNSSSDNATDRAFRDIYFKVGYFVKYKNYFAIAEAGPIQFNVKLGLAF